MFGSIGKLVNGSRLYTMMTNSSFLGTVVKVMLILYSSLIAPKIPEEYIYIFESKIFKIFAISLIAFIATRNIHIALLVSLALVLTMLGIVKMKNARSAMGMVVAPLDTVRDVTNDVIDEAQSIMHNLSNKLPSGISDVTGTALNVVDFGVDGAQSVLNYAVDTTSTALTGFSEGYDDMVYV